VPDLTIVPLHADNSDQLSKLQAMTNAADIGIIHHDNGLFEIDFPTIPMDAECIQELCRAISNLKRRQHEMIEIIAADLEETAYMSESGR